MSDMDVYQIRWANFRSLAAYPGGISDAAEKLGKLQGQVSHFGGERPIRNIGHKIARQIEAAYGKPRGWLDHEQAVEPITKMVHSSQPVRLDKDRMSDAVELLRKIAVLQAVPTSLADDPIAICAAYDFLTAYSLEATSNPVSVLDLMQRLVNKMREEVDALNNPSGDNGAAGSGDLAAHPR